MLPPSAIEFMCKAAGWSPEEAPFSFKVMVVIVELVSMNVAVPVTPRTSSTFRLKLVSLAGFVSFLQLHTEKSRIAIETIVNERYIVLFLIFLSIFFPATGRAVVNGFHNGKVAIIPGNSITLFWKKLTSFTHFVIRITNSKCYFLSLKSS
jgi:hypothetical protein